MARSRNIKPSFFTNEDLAELPFSTRLLFVGLWTLADREGRLEDRPKKIKMAIFAGDNVDVDKALDELHQAGFIQRYEADGRRCIHVIEFLKHQNPHYKEAESTLPKPEALPSIIKRKAPDSGGNTGGDNLGQASDKPQTRPPSDGGATALIPDSLNLIPDSGLSDSLIPDSSGKALERRKSAALPATTGETKPEVQVVIWLKSHGITAQATDPRVLQFASENVTEQHIIEAVAMARTRPGKADGRIHFAYLCGILTDVMHPKAGTKNGPSGIDQWLDSQGVSRETPTMSKQDLAAKQWLEGSAPAIER